MTIVTEQFSIAGTVSGWTTLRGSYGVTAYSDGYGSAPSLATGTAAVTNAVARRDADLGGVDQFCDCDVPVMASDSDRLLFLFLRMNSTSSSPFYAASFSLTQSSASFLRYSSPSASTTLQTTSGIVYPSLPFRVQFRVDGSGSSVTLRAWINNSLISTFGDSDASRILTGNYGGIGTYRSGSSSSNPLIRIDNWRAGTASDLGSGGPEPGRLLIAA